MNSQVIIEVLSKSTKTYDRGDKFKLYKTIPSLREYILIDQTQINVEQYSKTENKKWLYSEYDEEDTALVFNSFELEIPLSDVYEQVNFEQVEQEDSQNEE
ncbi:Uma2 family endonuclease [Microcoleus sp. S36b_A3]|uniref:Uma2 family endonuclease n=1 Tax=unclassified Microcoleus TaxID=2642155 RepID=UPI002FD0B3F3